MSATGVEALIRRIEADPGLLRAMRLVESQLDGDPGHDLAHALRVALWTVRLGGESVPWREAVVAALLHDLHNVPKSSPERGEASALCARRAEELLPSCGFGPEAVIRIAEAIEDHSYSRGAVPRSALGRALQDADRLEALGALGVLRTASCGARMGASYVDPRDPWAAGRALDDRRYTIDHFFVKLLRLEETPHTEAGRAEARRRTAFLRAFLEELGEELGEPFAAPEGVGEGPR